VSFDDQSDDELVRRACAQPEAIGALYERHAPAVFRYLARRVGPPAAEGLLGDVFVAAVAGRCRVEPHASGSALPWLYGIAGNVVRGHVRRSRPRATAHADADVVSGVDWDAIDARVDAAGRRAELRVALAALGDVDRELLLLVAWEGLSPSEAGRVLGLTPLAARSRLHRARTRAQAALDVTTSAAL